MGVLFRRSFLPALLLVLLATPVAAQSGAITGRVTDAETNMALQGAVVQATAAGGRVVADGLTNTDGRFLLNNVAPGSYTVRVLLVGFAPSERTAVQVTSGGTATLNVGLTHRAIDLERVVVSGSKKQERALEAPAHVEVVTEEQIAARPTLTAVDHLRGTPGVDIITQGIQSTNVVVRGFNNIFSGSLHTLTDHRMAGVPSLRVNVMHFVPTTSEDLSRMEVVLGPGAALYGPNTADGVLHLMTKSPLLDPGTTLAFTAGNQDVLQGTVRSGHRLTDNLGVKISAQVLSAEEFNYVDLDEVSEASRFSGSDAAAAAARAAFARDLGLSAAEANARIANIGARDNDVTRWSGEGRLDWRATDEFSATLQAGMTNVSSGIELTGLGAAQITDWKYSYYQARADWNRLFGQVYLNASDAGETFLLRTGQPIVDESTMLVAQLQHGMTAGPFDLVYGGDYFYTNPQTRGTINGIYEEEDETTEVGAYLQAETALLANLDLVLAGRLDDHSALPDPIFSPRAGLVFTPTDNQAIRLTYNRAFSTPSSLNQFLDLATSVPNQANDPLAAGAAALGYSVRVQGTGTTGFQFRQANGGYVMLSPFTPAQLGGPGQHLPADAASFYKAAVGVVAAQAERAGQPLPPTLVAYLSSFQPTAAEVGTAVHYGAGNPVGLSSFTLPDVAPIRESISTGIELGYQGVLNDRISLVADAWWSKRDQLVTPLTVVNPLVLLNGPELAAYLQPRLTAAGVPAAQQAAIIAGLASVPVGVISSPSVNAQGAQFLATYTNVDESLDVYGVDLGMDFLLTDAWKMGATASWVSDDHFDVKELNGVVTLNAPTQKGSLTLGYLSEDRPYSGEVRVRYNNEFPVQSGVYEGTACIGGGSAPGLPCVDTFTLLDLQLGYDLPGFAGAALQLNVQNLLDEDYVSYPGTPVVGRIALLRLKYSF